MGVCKYPDNGSDYDSLFNKADKCLYIAKNKGKNRYIIYDAQKHGDFPLMIYGKKRIFYGTY